MNRRAALQSLIYMGSLAAIGGTSRGQDNPTKPHLQLPDMSKMPLRTQEPPPGYT